MPSFVVSNRGEKRLYQLPEGSCLIGRHPDCTIVIDDATVSGRHATLSIENGECFIEDSGSRSGTFVNEHRIRSRTKLKQSDAVRFGDFVATFGDANEAGDTYVEEEPPREDSPASAEAGLKAVLNISKLCAGTVDLNAIWENILDTLLDTFTTASRVYVLIREDRTGDLIPNAIRWRRGDQAVRAQPSSAVGKKVCNERAGVFSVDAVVDESLGIEGSSTDFTVRSLICVPLLNLEGEPFGVLGVDSPLRFQFTEDDLDILTAVAAHIALCYDNGRLLQVYNKQLKYEAELQIARSIQRSLLPQELPRIDGYQFSALYESAGAIGGDYYDWFDLGDGKICVSFGDVAGRGVPGALIMIRLFECVRNTIRHTHDVVEAVCAINEQMCDTRVVGRFATYVLAVIDTQHHTVELCNAGHVHPIIRRANGSVEQFNIDLAGLPIGVVADYQYKSETRNLGPSDLVVLITDGIDEAMSTEGAMFGLERFLEVVKNSSDKSEELSKELLAEVRRHADGQPQNDDIAAMIFGRNPVDLPPLKEDTKDAVQRGQLTLRLDLTRRNFDSDTQRRFLEHFADSLNIQVDSVQIVDIRDGSLLVNLRFKSDESLAAFMNQSSSKELQEFYERWSVADVELAVDGPTQDPKPSNSDALRAWAKKLDFLLAQEAVCADPNQLFAIRHGIQEARNRIAKLQEDQ